MCKKAKAVTGDRPGGTKGKQWLSIDGVDFLDTPGTVWGKFDNEKVALHLAYIGSIRDEVLDISELVFELLKELITEHADELAKRYNLGEVPDDALALFDKIAVSRGFKLKGGDVDYERTAKTVIDDFRKGRLGKIMLEKPEKHGLVFKNRG